MASICFIELQPFPTTVGGGITHLIELSKELIRQGHDVSVISPPPAEDFEVPEELKKLKIYHVGMKHKKLEDYSGISRIGYYFWRVLFESSFVLGVMKIVKKNNFDVLSPQSPITPALACSFSGKNFWITAHGVHHQGFTKLYEKKGIYFVSKIGSKFYKFLESITVKRAEKVVCLGNESYDHYSKYKSCEIIPNGIDVNRFSCKSSKRPKEIISVSRFTEQKAIDKLILSMDKLKDYNLKVIGLGPLQKEVKKLCDERKNCSFEGYKTQNEIIPYLCSARFVILPSLFEGLPIVMLESMSSGVIPISTAVGDIPSLIKDGKNGFLLKDNSPDSISEDVRRAEKKDLEKISKSCRKQIATDYSWKKIAGRYLKAWGVK